MQLRAPNSNTELLEHISGEVAALQVAMSAIIRMLPAKDAIAGKIAEVVAETSELSPVKFATLPEMYRNSYNWTLQKFLAAAKTQ